LKIAKDIGRPIGPIAPTSEKVLLYALDAEESSVTQPEEELTARAQRIDEEYVRSNSAFVLSVLPATKPADLFILDEVFRDQMHLVDWLRDAYHPLGVEFSENIFFAPPKRFPLTVKELLREHEVAAVSTICFSYNPAQDVSDRT
jgi:hypothetical protein